MGSTAWSDSHYNDRVVMRASTGKATFAYDADVKSGKTAAKAHHSLDAKDALKVTAAGFKGRESRDSDAHPNSVAIATILDVTGSMSQVPKIVQKHLPKLMGLLTRKGYLDHPHILTMAVGDATSDKIPLQVGQFEAGIEIEDDLTNLVLEGGGGGSVEESYDLGMYFLANHTSIDCYEKRNKKGYAFFIGDECPYNVTPKSQIERFIDTKVQGDVPLSETVTKLKEKYECYFILPAMTTHYNDATVINKWESLFGADRLLKLQDANAICELIASVVGVAEGKSDLDDVADDLKNVGADKKVIDAVGSALAKVDSKSGGKMVKKAKGSTIAVADSGNGSGVATL